MDRLRRNDLHKLDVYRCALDLYRRTGCIIAQFPRGEADFRSQMRRASRSVPSRRLPLPTSLPTVSLPCSRSSSGALRPSNGRWVWHRTTQVDRDRDPNSGAV